MGAAGELDASAPSLAASGRNGPRNSSVLGGDGGHVDGVRDDPALERGGDLLRDDHAGAVLRLLGRGGEVRRDDDVVELEQRARVRLRRRRRARRRATLPERSASTSASSSTSSPRAAFTMRIPSLAPRELVRADQPGASRP